MKPGVLFLTRLFIYEPEPSTWSTRNTAVWNEDKDRDMKNVIVTLTKKFVLQKPANPCSSPLTPSAYLFLSRQRPEVSPGRCLGAWLQSPAGRPSSSALSSTPESLWRLYSIETKTLRKATVATAGRASLLSALCFDSRTALKHGDEPRTLLCG